MGHRDDGPCDSGSGAGAEDLVEERDEDGEAFEGEALGAEVALLDDLLEEVGAEEIGEDAGCRDGRGGGRSFEALLDPGAFLGGGDVHELGADGGRVDATGFLGVGGGFVGCALNGERLRREELAERVERGLEVAPAAEEIKGGVARTRRHGIYRMAWVWGWARR